MLIPDAGLAVPAFAILRLEEAMLMAALRIRLGAHSAKTNTPILARLGSLEVIHGFITDDGASSPDAWGTDVRGFEGLFA